MLSAWAFRAIALVVAISAESAKYNPLNDLDAFPAFQRGLRRYREHRHHHGHRHGNLRRSHKMALTHHYGVVAPGFAEPKHDEQVAEKATLPGRYQAVEKALAGMGGDLVNLKVTQNAAKSSRTELESKVGETVRHMNDAVSIKHAIAQKEALIRKEQSKLMGLEREAKHVEETHASLVSSLHRVLEPKLMFARERLGKKELNLEKEQQAVEGWTQKRAQLHDHALVMLKEKKALHANLLEAEQKVLQAKREEEVSRIKYEHERQKTGQEIQSFRYSETRLTAEKTHEKAAEEATLAAKESVSKITHVLEVESEKVEGSMEVNKNRIHQKMEQIGVARHKTEAEIVEMKSQYKVWQESQRQRAADVVRKGQETAMASQAYADRQRQVLDSAQTKVAREAESKSDWAGDTWDNDKGFTDDVPSISLSD